jgi:predicted RecB family endonuclease
MNVEELHDAYEKAVSAFLRAVPTATETQAEACIEAIAEMVIKTIATQIQESSNATDNNRH